MPAEDFDIALSLLSSDLPIARELADELAPFARVFLYDRAQETLVGKDGLEQFRATFLTDSKLNVILYRDGYGKTPWTRVELAAIQERALRDGWGTLVVVSLAPGETPPTWYPYPRISSSLSDYGVRGVASTVLARARENGAPDRKETPAELAARLSRRAADEERRRQFGRSADGVQALNTELQLMFDRIDHTCTEILRSDSRLNARCGRKEGQIIVIAGGFSLSLYWDGRYVNTLDGSALVALTFRGVLPLPGSLGRAAEEPQRIQRQDFTPSFHGDGNWRWTDNAAQVSGSTTDVADTLLADLIRRAHGA